MELIKKELRDLQLIEKLNANNNKKIKNVNHLSKLKILDCSYNCGIDQEGIKDLQLIEELNANDNKKIKNVNHLTKLKILDCSRIVELIKKELRIYN